LNTHEIRGLIFGNLKIGRTGISPDTVSNL